MSIKAKFNNGKYITYDTISDLITDLYYNVLILNDSNAKKLISTNSELFPMYDIFTENIYLVPQDEIYDRLTKFNFKPITDSTYELIKKTKKTKMIDFLSNFDLEELERTFYKYVHKKIPEIGKISECVRPSFMPFLRTTTPYYTKDELIYMALNLGLWRDNMDIGKACEIIQNNDISGDTLLRHQIYIRENNAASYVKYYTFIGSSVFNNYLRFSRSYDPYLAKNITNFTVLLKKAPSWDKSYYLYRWISNDDFIKNIKVGDVWTDNSFMSTTRQAFVDPKESYFGYILMKIKVPKNTEGVGLAVEYYSNFPEELEIVLPPGKYKLISNEGIKYYHPDNSVNNKVTSKYVLEWIGHNDKFMDHINTNESNIIDIPKFDIDNNYSHGSVYSRLDEFKYQFKSILQTTIGNQEVIFRISDIDKGDAYSKFFYLNSSESSESRIYNDSAFFLDWIDNDTGNINMIIEVGNIISVNYYFRFIGAETKILGDYTFMDILNFIDKLCEYFGIGKVLIHPDYKMFWHILDKSALNEKSKDINSYHLRQLYICDTNYFSQFLMYYIWMLSTRGENIIGDFTKFIYKQENFATNISTDAIYFIMNIDLKEFIDDYTKNKDIIYDSFVEMIIRIAYKIIKNKNNKSSNKTNIKRSIRTLNKNIIPGTKVIDLFILIIEKYNYLTSYLIDYLFTQYKINLEDIHHYKVINDKYSTPAIYDMSRITKLKRIIKIKPKYNLKE